MRFLRNKMSNWLAIGFILTAGCKGVDSSKETHDMNDHPSITVNFDAVYIVNGQDSSISVLDSSTSEIKATWTLANASFPHHISLSPDSKKLAVAVPGMDLSGGHEVDPSSQPSSGGHEAGHGLILMAGRIIVLDAVSGKTLGSKELPSMNHNAVFSPDGKEIWTAQMVESGAVLVLDAETLETINEIKVGRYPAEVTFASDGKKAFIANGSDNTVSVIDVENKTLMETIEVGENPVGAWPGNDGLMYVDNETGRSISTIDPASLSVVQTLQLGFTPAMAAVGPDGTLWVTDTDSGRVVIYSKDSSTEVAAIPTGAGAHAIIFSADGQLAFVTNQAASTISVIETAARKVKIEVEAGQKPNGLVFRKSDN